MIRQQTLVTCGIWSLVWACQAAKHIKDAQMRRRFKPSDNAMIYVLLSLFGFGLCLGSIR
ncbi:DUF4234 domain-containing protein [Paenibacillus sp. 1011MAR3C5]|uniref:DUF4234 domain-containing protein n=1 Tax=Paenibacillus sp. 1011MAR3C5 TaxID=1675787 RepID=UPI000E6D5697|nr:DUF4234 domain-containing protein [Paenibacillus sp. 1011MAR3C5]